MRSESHKNRGKAWQKPLMSVFALVFLFLLVQWVVKTYQKPSHMGVIESQSMNMAVQPPAGAMPVDVETVQTESFSGQVTYTGSAVAFNDIAIYSRVTGRIVAMPVYPGDRVTAGQLLAQLDSQELTSRVQEAQYGQQAATQQYYAALRQQGQASAQMQRAKAAIETAKANLKYRSEQVRRSRTLVQEAVITPEEAQKDESDYRTAQSEYQQAVAELKAAQRGASASQFQSKAQHAQAAQAKATAQTQAIIQGYTQIRSPQSGFVTQRLISPGTLVSPGMSILQIAQINPIRIQANVAESDVNRIQRGATVLIWSQKFKTPIQGKISAIFPRADLQTRTTIVEVVIPNEQQQFLPGDFTNMSIQTSQSHETLTVSNSTLVQRNQQQAVWVVRDNKAHLQYVTTGDSNGMRTAITQGLQARDKVIVQGQQNLTEGSLITQASYGPEGLKALPKPVSTHRLSPENQYRLQKSMGMYIATISLQRKPPRAGDNTLIISIISGPGMSMPTDNLHLEATNVMPSMAEMPVPKPTVQRTGDGQFTVHFNWIMSGLWQVALTVKDGNQTVGVVPLEVEVND